MNKKIDVSSAGNLIVGETCTKKPCFDTCTLAKNILDADTYITLCESLEEFAESGKADGLMTDYFIDGANKCNHPSRITNQLVHMGELTVECAVRIHTELVNQGLSTEASLNQK
jgi:hypothetical protein